MRDGVAAVFGPTIAETSRHVEAVCDAVEVPHFRAYWDLDDDDDDGDVVATSPGREGGLYSLSVYPVYAAVGRSLVDFVVAHDWKSFTVLYDSDQGIQRTSHLQIETVWILVLKIVFKIRDLFCSFFKNSLTYRIRTSFP